MAGPDEFTCKELGAALGVADTRGPDKFRRACGLVIVQFQAHPQTAFAELELAAKQLRAGKVPHDANYPMVRLNQALAFDAVKTWHALVSSRAWTEAEIMAEQIRLGQRHLPWHKR